MMRYLHVISVLVISEILLLLVAPLTYYASLPPSPLKYAEGPFPLSDAQIRKSWPDLPTAQEIVDTGKYAMFDGTGWRVLPNSTATKIYYQSIPNWWDKENTTLTTLIENCTKTNVPSSMGLIPLEYNIYLQLNNSAKWVMVEYPMLNNSTNPPYTPLASNNGFLGTNMPTNHGLAATTVISITIAIGACYVLYVKQSKNTQLKNN